ncbi:LWXIA domain-containing protein [Burkholderia stagnalis]|uniref:LWXIA domain-containing protein n=1 Tax=Burkholderia stagnalis TaxID=1503054 RepID=UPI000753419D|nr:LWXIA domain-containing protein [Burkholderia stagnalis]KVN62473.1 peptidoglycan-binding protein [Burkholderia stagnalis]
MLDIDGVGMGVNWMAFLERTLEAERAKAASEAAQQTSDPSKQQVDTTPPPPPIAVQVSPDSDPSKPTNAEIASATSLIQRLAEQYRPTTPDITVDDPLTKAAQTAIQGAQTKYDTALKDEHDKQAALTTAQNDTQATQGTVDQARTAYDQAHAATAKAEKELDVTTDAGYMIAYAQQAKHDEAALDPNQAGSAQADANAALDKLKAAMPGIGDDPTQASQANWTPQQKQAYDTWQHADAKLSEAKARHNADVANSNLALAQLQSYASNGDYADAMDVGIGRVNDQLAPLDRVIDAPDKLKPEDAQANLKSAADDANYANACLNAAADASKVADIQITCNAVSGKYGPTVMNTTVAAQQDLLDHAQASARVSGGYLQMLYANRQVADLQTKYDAAQKASTQWHHDNPGAMIKDPQVDLDLGDAYAQLSKAKDGASLAHDGYVAAYGNALAIHYDDVAAGVQNQYDHRTMCVANDPTPLAIKGIKTIASALHQADDRMTATVNERATKQALVDAQAKQSQLKGQVDDLQKQYDAWNRDHGIGTTPSLLSVSKPQGTPANIPLTAPVPFVVNPYAQQLSNARTQLDQANKNVQQTQLLSETLHQQVLFNEFDAHLDERLRNAKTESDQKDYAKALSDFFGAHRGELSQSLLDKAGEATQHGATIDFGKLDDTRQRNLVGIAIGLSPDSASDDPHAAQFSDQKKLDSIDKVRHELLKVGGGASTRVNVMPIVYASKDAGLMTSAIFKVTNASGDTHYVDDQGSKYSSIGNFIDDNELSSDGTLDIATGYDANGAAQIDRHNTAHDDSWWESVMHTLGAGDVNLGMLVGGLALEVAGGLLDATVFGAPLGIALNAAGAGLMYTSAAAAVVNSGYDLGNRMYHDRTISPFDAGARADYINLVPLGIGGAGKALTLASRTTTAARVVTRAGGDAAKFASRVETGTRFATKAAAYGGAADAAGQFGYDLATGHTERLASDATSFLLNAGLAAGPQQIKALSTGIVRRTGSFGARDLGNRAVSIGDQRVTIGQDKYAAASTLRVGRQQATFDGKTITVAKDGTLMAGNKILTYKGVPIRALNRGNDVNTGARGRTESTAFLDRDGTITIGERVKGLVRTRFDETATDARITADEHGGLSLSDGIQLKYAHEIAPPRPAATPVAPPQDDQQRQPPGDAHANRVNPAAPSERDAAPASGEPAAASSRATSQARRSTADVRERAAENDQDARRASRADRRSGDARTLQYRRVADPAEAGAGGALKPLTFRQRVAWTILNAMDASPLSAGFVARAAGVSTVTNRPLVETHEYGGRKLYVVRNDRAGGTFATRDGVPMSGHELALDARYAFRAPADIAEPIVLIGKHADETLASELANVWNRPVYVAPRGALAADGTLHATSGYLRFDPAPHPDVDLGPLHADGNAVFHAGTGKPVDLDEHLGALIGFGNEKGGFALGRGAVVGLYEDAFSSRTAQRGAALGEQRGLALLRRRFDLPTVSMEGPFSHANRVAVLYQPRGALHTHDVEHGVLPKTLKADTLDQLRALKTLIAEKQLYFDVQGVYHDGRLLITDPGRIEIGNDGYRGAHDRVDDQLRLLESGVERGDIQLAHPETTETAPAADKPGLVARLQMRFGGAPLPNEVSALAQQSGTLAQQLRMLDDNGWRVRVGKRGGGSRIDAKKKRVTLDGALGHPGSMTYTLAHEAKHAVEAIDGSLGLDYSGRRRFTRKALEAEARAQLNAFEARYEIRMASGVDIAAHVKLPDAIQEVADNWRPSHDYAGTVATLADAFAHAPVSGAGGKTYDAFYGDAFERGAARAGRTMPAPQETQAGGDGPRSMREIQAQRAAWSRANVERNASPFGAGDAPSLDALSLERRHRLSLDPRNKLVVFHADTLHDGTLLGPDGTPVDPHGFTLLNHPPPGTEHTLILSARHANEGAAAQLANLWQRPVYAPHPDAVGDAGALTSLSGMNRYVPAAYRQPSLGELSVDPVRGRLYVDDPARPVDPADFLGPVLGSGAFKTVFDGGTGQAIGVFRDESLDGIVEAATLLADEQGGLATLRDVYKLPVSTADGPFTAVNRVGVVLKPHAQLSSVDVEFGFGLPGVVSHKGLADLARMRRIAEAHGLHFDFQVLFGRNGDVLLHDPGPVMPESVEVGDVLARIDDVAAKIHYGLATGRIRLAHPAMAEQGAYAPRRGIIDRIVTAFRGVVLKMQAHALARLSPTLTEQMRIAKSDGWKVKLGARGAGQYVDAERRVIVLDGNTRHAGTLVFALAHEAQHSTEISTGTLGLDHSSHEAYVNSLLLAEARAQRNAARVRAEILDAGGGDIAAHVTLPDGLARAAQHAYESGDPAALQALAERFGDTRTSLPGHPTYRVLYAQQARALTGDARLPKLAAPGSAGRTPGASGRPRGGGARERALMTRARKWLDERGLRTLTRIDGGHLPALRDLVRETGRDAHVLIARAGTPAADAPPRFIATAEVDAHGAIALKIIDPSLTRDERQALEEALSLEHDADPSGDAAAARRAFDFYKSPVPLAELQQLGGPSKLEQADGGDAVEFARTGPIDAALAAAIDALGSAKHYANANKAIAGASHADTIYAVDRKTGDVLGHATYDRASGAWHYQEKAPLERTKVVERALPDAFQRRVNTRVRPRGPKRRIPLSRARQRGVDFVATRVEPDMIARIGRFDPVKAPKTEKADALPSRFRWRYASQTSIAMTLDAGHRVALLLRARTAALLRRQGAQAAVQAGTQPGALPAGAAAAHARNAPATQGGPSSASTPLHDALVAAHLLPSGPGHALDFSGHNAVHLLAIAEQGGLSPDTHRVYVYLTDDPIAHGLDAPNGVLVPGDDGKLAWHDDWRDTSGPGVPLDASPIGGGPYGANVHLLLTELPPDGLATYAPGTRLRALNDRVERLTNLQDTSRRSWVKTLRDWAKQEKNKAIGERDTLQAQIDRDIAAARTANQPPPAHPELEIKPYQPALVSSTLVEWKQRYGDGGMPDPLAHVARLKAFIEREGNTRAGPLELQDTTGDAPPPALMADAQAWRWLGKWLHVARDYTAGGARFAPVPPWKGLNRKLSAAVAIDRKILRAFFKSSRDVQDRVVLMSRAYRLSDDPQAFLAALRRSGAARAVVSIVVDPHTLAAAQGKKHDPALVRDVKAVGDPSRAQMDYATATITGENGRVVHLDDLTEQNLHAWLDAAAEGGFVLRLETAPGRALVSRDDQRYQAGTNDQYHDYERLASMLETWAKRHPGKTAPHVMVTFHGWDAVPEPVPGAGHVTLVNRLLDRPTLKWVHVGLSYATHGSDFIANQELTTALAKMLVKRARNGDAFERIHGADALTRVFERIEPDKLFEQHQMLLAEIDRIGREKGMTPKEIDTLVSRLYEGNTTKLLNRARHAVAGYVTRAWEADPAHAPSRKSKARRFTEAWQKDIGSKLDRPQQLKTLGKIKFKAAKRPDWREIVQLPELLVDETKPLSDARLVGAQAGRTTPATRNAPPPTPLTPEQAALAELNALRLQRAGGLRSWLTWPNAVSLMAGVAAGVGVGAARHYFGVQATSFKQTNTSLFVGARTGRLVQALHQDSVRALQGGDPRLFRRVIDRFVRTLNGQLDAHQMDEASRGASLALLANEARVKVDRLIAQHDKGQITAEDAVAYTKLIANDMIAQMQGVLGGTSIQQMHQGNPRRFFGKLGRSAALAGYVGIGETAVQSFLNSHTPASALGAVGALLGVAYTSAVHLGAMRNLSIERRSQTVRFIDAASDVVSVAGGYAGVFLGSAAAIHTNLPLAISGATSATLLGLARADTHFPNLTKSLTGRIPTAIVLVPIAIYVGNAIYTEFDDKHRTPSKSNVMPPGGTPSPTPSASPSASPSATSSASPSGTPSASPSATPSAAPSPAPASTQPPGATPPPATPQPPRYFVVDGDSLWVIADRHRDTLLDAAHVSRADQQKMSRGEQDAAALREILQLNPNAAADPQHLTIGMPLVVG